MKFKTTAKAIREEGGLTISIPYCNAQNLLHYEDPIAYTCGVYGWNFDVYEVDGATICTGYRGMVGATNYELTRKYDELARPIVNDWNHSYEDNKAKVTALLHEFIAEFRK